VDAVRRTWANFYATADGSPGAVIQHNLLSLGMTQAEFARRMGLSVKHVNRMIRGRAGFSPEVALGMEYVLGIKAEEWMRMQADYRLAKVREKFEL
jgi:HTH-type transcriptional regulator/antitoxin HigA